jgi:hypothetical protein
MRLDPARGGNSGMTAYTFKPGFLRSPQSWVLEGTQLAKLEADKVIDLLKVTEAKFGSYPASGGLWIAVLILKADGMKYSFTCSDRLTGENRRRFLALCLDVAEVLSRENVRVKFIETIAQQLFSWALTALGAGAAAAGLKFMVPNLLHPSSSESGFSIRIGIYFLFIGVLLAWAGSPWKNKAPKTPSEAAESIRRAMAM